MKYGYLFYTALGYLAGSILFGRLVPLAVKGVDVEEASADGNPGTFNEMCIRDRGSNCL